MTKRFDFKSIKFKLWIYFLALSIGIMAIIWFLQIYMLNNQYDKMKRVEVDELAISISRSFNSNDEDLPNKIREYCNTSDIYIMMELNSKLVLFTPDEDVQTPVYKYREELPKLRSMMNESESASVSYSFSTVHESYKTLAYGRTIYASDNIPVNLYMFAPLYPMTSTVKILREQLFFVTLISLIIAFGLALFLSDRISKPLRNITRKTNEMSKGNYEVQFDLGSYTEIDNLSKTLNKAAIELGREDNLQKDLIANVSHDLKTPLTMIKSYAEMIIDLDGDDKDKRDKHLNIIINESERMAKLVSDMSQLTQLQNQKIELEKTTFDLAKVIAELLQSYEVYEDQGYTFIFNSPKTCPVFADEGRIKQVLSNFIGNAIKYSNENKEITLNVKKQGKEYKVEIIDKGPGISKEDLPHIWDRYYRTSNNYKRSLDGSGLGLSIAKQILTLHNFNFGVTSKVNSGTTFWFNIEVSNETLKDNNKEKNEKID